MASTIPLLPHLLVAGLLALNDVTSASNPLAALLLGVNHHSPTPKSLAVLKAGGFTWIRDDVPWADVETSKNMYNFSSTDIYFHAIRDLDMSLMSILSSVRDLSRVETMQ